MLLCISPLFRLSTVLTLCLLLPLQPAWAEEAEHDAHAEHDDHDVHRDGITLSDRDIATFGIVVAEAAPGNIEQTLSTTGEVRLNQDRLAHIVPRLTGVVHQVHANLGDTVTAGDLLAEIDSRELAEAKAEYLAARERVSLAEATYDRESGLRGKGVSAEQEYLQARLGQAEARIALRTATQALYALGVSKEAIERIAAEDDAKLTRYQIRAPFTGTVIAKHITLGEMLEPTDQIFTIADLSSVWVDLSVYPDDVGALSEGQAALISAGPGTQADAATITYISPVIEEATRTLLARAVLANPTGLWRPGMFVTATLVGKALDGAIVVPRAAIVSVDDQPTMFVSDDGFKRREVRVGAESKTHAEVIAGLSAGERYVSAGASILKAELAKESFGDGHAH